jgi:ubiquitin thioesterase protein OTUB1
MRPSDEEILKQEEAIRREVVDKSVLIGPLEPSELLQEEYKDSNNNIYKKFDQLNGHLIRRVRGDGNCFFRAMSYEIIKQTSPENSAKLLDKIKDFYKQVGFDKMATEDFLGELESHLTKQKSELEEEWQVDEGRSHAVVVVLRLLTSAYLRIQAADYEPFLCEYTDMATYCQRQVECIGVESEQIHITALSKALGARITVYYIDAGGADGVEEIEFLPDTEIAYSVKLLYRPGHYDLLYSSSLAP